MKKIIAILVGINLCLVAMVGCLVLLAETYPFQPGDNLYSVQHLAEQARLRTSTDTASQAEFALDLADRRLADLAMAGDQQQVEASIGAFDIALDEAIERIEAAPDEAHLTLLQRGQVLLSQAETVVTAIQPGEDSPGVGSTSVAALIEKIAVLQTAQTVGNQQSSNLDEMDNQSRITGEVVSFLGVDVDHKDFPLNGGHEELECETCHDDGEYADTPTQCSHCHPQPIDEYLAVRGGSPSSSPIYNYPDYKFSTRVYPEHFPGECSDCHGIDDWVPTQFGHETVIECISCHEDDLPKLAMVPDSFMIDIAYKPDLTYVLDENDDHYPGDCLVCHTDTTTWETFAYNHDGVVECESCHQSETPQRHYPGICLNCHEDVEDWNVAIVNHTGLTDCLSCHNEEIPGGHYEGQCSRCHNSEAWYQATFNHGGYSDCSSCHSKPAKHFKGDCANCHTTSDWGTASFSHKGMTNCKSCHDEPDNHYAGECTLCHSSRSWNTGFFTHLGSVDCQSCHGVAAPTNHYTSNCSTCHAVDNWGTLVFSHSNVTNDCLSCHTAPGGHYYGECTDCHDTTNWGSVDFDHTHYKDCLSCHETPSGHYLGQCSNCHVTGNWNEVTFDHRGLDDCASCHTKDGHWPGQCSNCHTDTSNWGVYTFDHTGYTNCRSCHTRPAGHPRGQCSKCHTTDGWLAPTATPTEVVIEEKTERKSPVMRTLPPNPAVTPTPAPTEPPPAATPVIEPIDKTIPVPVPDPSTQETATAEPMPILPSAPDW